MSENKSCQDFIAAYKSKIVTCFSCHWWNMDDFVCLNPDEVKKRKKANEFDEMDKLMRDSKAVYIQPD